jgi:hypothetical protein
VTYGGLNNLTNALEVHGRKARAWALIDGPEGGHARGAQSLREGMTEHIIWIGCAIQLLGRNAHLILETVQGEPWKRTLSCLPYKFQQ